MMGFKNKIKISLFLCIIIAALLSPFIIWHLTPSKPSHIVIVDKTVPKQTYREHKALMWVLNNLKYTNKQTMRAFQYNQDYWGFFPLEDFKYVVKDLHSNLENVDLIYLADTYGVYTEDFYRENLRGERSQLIYGGVEPWELGIIRELLKEVKVLLGEFNAFATPTKREVGIELETLFGVEWNGWIGRYFRALDKDNEEVPIWLIKNYERQYKTKWSFTGPGFGFVNIDDTVIVLKQGEDTGNETIKIIFTEKAIKEFKVKNNVTYYYWFDILKPKSGTEILAHYKIDLSEKGGKILRDFGLPDTFPAVVRTHYPYRTYYFAGDFSDIREVPSFWNVSFYRFFMSKLSSDVAGNQTYFFWNVYYPLIENILKKELNSAFHKS